MKPIRNIKENKTKNRLTEEDMQFQLRLKTDETFTAVELREIYETCGLYAFRSAIVFNKNTSINLIVDALVDPYASVRSMAEFAIRDRNSRSDIFYIKQKLKDKNPEDILYACVLHKNPEIQELCAGHDKLPIEAIGKIVRLSENPKALLICYQKQKHRFIDNYLNCWKESFETALNKLNTEE